MTQTRSTANRHRARHQRGPVEHRSTRKRSAPDDQVPRRPGVGTFLGVGLLGGVFVAAVQQAPHDSRWNPLLVLVGAVVIGLVAWAARYGIYRMRLGAGEQPDGSKSDACPPTEVSRPSDRPEAATSGMSSGPDGSPSTPGHGGR